MIFSGLVGATGAGLILDYFKLFKEVAVVFLSLGMLSFVWFLEVITSFIPSFLRSATIVYKMHGVCC